MSRNKEEFGKLPRSYRENTREEREILKLADNFLRQYKYLYPDRIKPPLYLKNECNVNKLVCTSLCPLKITMPTDMRKWDFCANYFADYFDYEILHPPHDCSQSLPSVECIVNKRKGNSLELSVVLCSFLLASDYDAYVVQGYATKYICENLESREERPPIKFDTDSEYHKLYFTGLKPGEVKSTPSKYQIDFKTAKSFWMENKTVLPSEENIEKQDYNNALQEEVSSKRRIHFWVLLCSHENGSLDSFFIESTTGEKKSVEDSNYLGIEFVWNNKNFWCNNQLHNKSCKNIQFDFHDCKMWEVFLPEYSICEGNEQSIRMPGSWAANIEVTTENLNTRFRPEGKQIFYKKAKVEKYNPNVLRNGLLYRMIYYDAEDKTDPVESHAFFTGRKDLLEYRKTDFKKQTVVEIFASGRSDSLKEHEYSRNGNSFPQKLTFFSHLRKDHLSCRTWTSTFILDKFIDRSDLLTSREIHFISDKPDIGNQFQNGIETMEVVKQSEINTLDTGELTEKLKENIKKDLEEEISKDTENISKDTDEENSKNSGEKDVKKSSEEMKEVIDAAEEREETRDEKQEITPKTSETSEREQEHDIIHSSFITPLSFDAEGIIFEDVDFNTWTLEFFLDSIDPSERYATSESDSDKTEKSITLEDKYTDQKDSSKASRETIVDDFSTKGTEEPKEIWGEKPEEQMLKDAGEEMESKTEEQEDRNQDNVSDVNLQSENETTTVSSHMELDEERPSDEGEFDKEMEIYDEINFDALSDEELEIDYQLFLSKLWTEYVHVDEKEIFYIKREFQKHKDLRNRETLKLKKKIIRKRRKNVKYLQRMELGKPMVRHHKQKSEEESENICTNGLITYLDLKEKVGIENSSSIKEFHSIENLEKTYVDSVNSEVIKKESLKLLDSKLKENQSVKFLNDQKKIRLIKNSYKKDSEIRVEHSVKDVWFDIETDSYRLDFQYPGDRSSRKILLFTKPESSSTDFYYTDYLCRQILPNYDTTPTKRSQLYSYLVALMKKEPLVLREQARFEIEMNQILETRRKERRILVSGKKMESTPKAYQVPSTEDKTDTKASERYSREEDIVTYTTETLNLSLPLSENDAKKVYSRIFDEFCEEVIQKLAVLEKEYDKTIKDFDAFLSQCKSWKSEMTSEQEFRFIKACGKFEAAMSSIRFRCNAQRKAIKSNYIRLKKNLYNDARLETFIKKVCNNQKN